MSKTKKILISVAMTIALALGLVAVVPTSVSAIVDSDGTPVGDGDGGALTGTDVIGSDQSDMPDQLFGDGGIVTNIISIIIFIVGALCVIMLVYGGVRYIMSAGDSGKVGEAKNTILYAIIGLIVCIVAYALVRFILQNIVG